MEHTAALVLNGIVIQRRTNKHGCKGPCLIFYIMKKIAGLLLLVFVACNNTTIDDFVIEIMVDEAHLISETNLFTDIEIIPIEFKNGFVINNFAKIIKHNRFLYILDLGGVGGGRIFKIDDTGKIHNVLSKHGQGPGEYLYLMDFDISSSNGDLYLVDNYSRKILVYNQEFQFLQLIKPNVNFPVNTVSLIEPSKEFLIWRGNGMSLPELDFHFILIDSEGIITDKIFPIDEFHTTSMGGLPRIWKVENEIHYLPSFSNTIYSIKNGITKNHVTFNFNRPVIQYKEYVATRNREDVIHNRSFIEGDNHIIFKYLLNSQPYLTIVDKSRKQHITLKNQKDPSCGCGSIIKTVNFFDDQLILEANNMNVESIVELLDPDNNDVIRDLWNNSGESQEILKEQILVFTKIDYSRLARN